MWEILQPFLGVVAAVAWGAVGWAVARKESGESFDAKKFGKTVLIGFILGLLGYGVGVDIDTVEQFTSLELATILVDKVSNLVL